MHISDQFWTGFAAVAGAKVVGLLFFALMLMRFRSFRKPVCMRWDEVLSFERSPNFGYVLRCLDARVITVKSTWSGADEFVRDAVGKLAARGGGANASPWIDPEFRRVLGKDTYPVTQ